MDVHIRDSDDTSVAHSSEIATTTHLIPWISRLGISEIASIFGEGLEHLRQQGETKSASQIQIC